MIHTRYARVAIYDTDASGLIYFGAPARWFTDAESEIYPLIGLDFPMMHPEAGGAAAGGPSSPTRAYSVAIDVALRYHEDFRHDVWLSRVGTTSFTFSHRITRDSVACVTGEVHRVYVDVAPDGTMTAIPVPEFLRRHVSNGPID